MVGPAGVYVHVPFCARACPYCDFDFVVGRAPDLDTYLQGLAAEIAARGLSGTVARTLYLGGGTPSLLGAAGLTRLLSLLHRLLDTRGSVETTVELNPEHADDVLLDALAQAGCHRVSLGAQTLDASGLVQLGRVHDARASVGAASAAAQRGLSVSADLIVGWSGQTVAALEHDLHALVDAGVRHLSVYALTIEPGTPWEALVRRGKRSTPDDDAQAELLERVASWARAGGWEHYEVASYAADSAARARHNLGYWTGQDYVGLGPSAASAWYERTGAVCRRTNPRGLAAWRADPAGAEIEHLEPIAAAAEGLWLGLRVLSGMSVRAYLERFCAVDRQWLVDRVERGVRQGDLEWAPAGHLRVSPQRWLMHDAIAAEVLA